MRRQRRRSILDDAPPTMTERPQPPRLMVMERAQLEIRKLKLEIKLIEKQLEAFDDE